MDEHLAGSDLEQRFEVDRTFHGRSLYDFLDALAGPLDRRATQAAAKDRRLVLNDEPTGPSVTLRTGDVIEVLDPLASLRRRPDDAPLTILFQDESLIVADKPPGIPFAPAGRGGQGRSATERLGGKLGDVRPRPVHRLDLDTSGVLVAALGSRAEAELKAEFRDGRAQVEYEALVRGRLPGEEGLVDAPLSHRGKARPGLMVDERHGQEARTAWRVVERLRGYARLVLTPEAGRSHQVRAHLAHLGNPAVCDALYGEDDRILLSQLKLDYRPKRGRPERPLLARPALHAARFLRDGRVVAEAPQPRDLEVLLNQLRRLRPLD